MSNPNIKSHRTARISEDGFDESDVLLGVLADEGTDLGDPEVQTETYAAGAEAGVGATFSATLRVLGSAFPWLSDVQDYAADLSEVQIRIFGQNGIDFTEYGPATIIAAFEKGRDGDRRRKSALVRFSCSGDVVEDFMREGSLTE